MLMGHAEGLPKLESAKDLLLSDPVSELDGDEEADIPSQILYTASFEELASKNIQYDTIIWVSISLLLVLAWGIGIIMLLYLPFRRWVIKKDIASRELYVTSKEIVYKVSRPSFIPFCGERKIEKHVPLSFVIDIIIEQGFLQSLYGIHTFRIESIAHGKAAPVDELRVQGVYNPALLRKVVVTEASKAIQNVGNSWNLNSQILDMGRLVRMDSLTLGPAVLRSPSTGWKTMNSPPHSSVDNRGIVPSDLMLHKLEEVNKSVKVSSLEIPIEWLIY
ncbi:uncharacterized protein LOC111410329 [Olea europaea subsp. europaea]|uniref:Uncharacterized protein LOC111410329 n=1 Tax=Olea europaea subsp. europaea TaxID=158383 RepID=A0A8S0UW90_OLEEU|nr:uncharacterized protein LOC111410329 [Olea europaea subsp. europaea]